MRLRAVFLVAFFCPGPFIAAQTPAAAAKPAEAAAPDPSELWVDRAMESLDLFVGAGGPEWVPKPQTVFQLVKVDRDGFSRGWDVKDANGVEWAVKYGLEVQPEIVASRIVWAMGYHQPPYHYVQHWSLAGGDRPGPQTPSRFRPDIPGWKRTGLWSWADSPFKGTTPFQGLKVLMRILNNWDLLARNTAVFERQGEGDGPRRMHVVIDLGASLGRTRILPNSGSRNDLAGFEKQGYIKGVDGKGFVRFDDLGRRHRAVFDGIRPEEVRWMSDRLARLSEKQWQDAFRAAHYDEATTNRYLRKIREKVEAGRRLSAPAPAAAGGAGR